MQLLHFCLRILNIYSSVVIKDKEAYNYSYA